MSATNNELFIIPAVFLPILAVTSPTQTFSKIKNVFLRNYLKVPKLYQQTIFIVVMIIFSQILIIIKNIVFLK